jgi:hypothetical protein
MKKLRQVFVTVMVVLLLFSAVVYGDTWSANKRLTNNIGGSYSPAIAVDGSNIYVVWYDNTPGNVEIYFKQSVDGGITWTANKRLTNNAADSMGPAITVDGSNIYVVWYDYLPENSEIYFKRSVDGGVTWTANKQLTNNAGDSFCPAIAVDGSKIYAFWHNFAQDADNAEIYFKRSVNGGLSWAAEKRITNNAGNSIFPAIAVDGSKIYVVWEDNTPGNDEIYFKRSVDGGITWTANKRLTTFAGYSVSPAIAVNGSNIYVVWCDSKTGSYEIYFKRSVNGGVTWTAEKNLSNNSGYSWYPAIAVNGLNICVVWYDYTPGNAEIYYKRSDDGGVTWTANKQLTNNAGSSVNPAIAVHGSNIYVVWQDNTPGNNEIYFKKGVLD